MIKDEVVLKEVMLTKSGVVAEGYWGNRKVYKVTFCTHTLEYKCWWKYPPGKGPYGACERKGWAFEVFGTADSVQDAMEQCKQHFYIGRKVKSNSLPA